MKTLLMLLLLSACSSGPKGPQEEITLKAGLKFDEIKAAKSNPPSKCYSYETSQYCLWDDKIMHFKNDIFQSIVPQPVEPSKYKLASDALYNGKEIPKIVFVRSGNGKAEEAVWKKHSPLIKAVLVENGFKVVEKQEDSEQTIRVVFGIKEMEGGNLRYLNLTSYDTATHLNSKKEKESWKIKTSSWGTGRDMDKIIPVLMVVVNDYLKKPTTGPGSPTVDEGTFETITFKNYFGVY